MATCKVIGNFEAMGVSKTKIFQGKYEVEFPEKGGGGGGQTKQCSMGEVCILSGTTHLGGTWLTSFFMSP